MRQIAFDTETTGLSPLEGHRIIEIGCVEIIDRRITGNTWQTYVNPEREMEETATRISGLTTEFLQDKPKFPEVLTELLAFIQDAELIIHNAPFDISFINNELRLLQHSFCEIEEQCKIFDTLALARQLHPGQRNSLDALCRRYKIDNSHRKFHGALLDAKILAEVYLAMTAGQTNFMLTQDDEDTSFTHRHSSKQNKFITRNSELKIIQATAAELAEHNQYLTYMKTKSEGVCLWEQQDE